MFELQQVWLKLLVLLISDASRIKLLLNFCNLLGLTVAELTVKISPSGVFIS
jgi:hypothetical protein